jgi:REP element-mobilizing transposase RayT
MATPPRRVLPGTTWLVTRRCVHREFLLRPSATTNAILRYVVAVAAARSGVLLHVLCVMSNHVHIVLTDPEARLPEFMRNLNSLVARAVNASLGRSETFWDSTKSYSAVEPIAPEDLVDKAAYVLANPVQAGLVPTGREWPGVWSDPDEIGGPATEVRRPDVFFSDCGPMPEKATLQLTAPPGYPSDFRADVVRRLAEREREAAAKMAAEGRSFLGAQRVRAQRTTDRPKSREDIGGLDPRVAARDKWKRIEALVKLVEFRAAYHEARAKLRQGVRDVIFPAGTYWLRVAQGVRCAPA